MVELEVWYDQQSENQYGSGEPAVIVRTADELDALVDRVLEETKDHRCPPVIEVSIRGQQLPVLEVGLGQTKGFITYHAEDGGSTKGDGNSEEYVEYVYGGNLSEIAADAEVGIQEVRRGLHTFLESGTRPSVIRD